MSILIYDKVEAVSKLILKKVKGMKIKPFNIF